jgi:CRP-like cAMP-binding protein
METKIKILSKCELFNGVSEKDIQNILLQISGKELSFKKDQIIAFEADACKELALVVKGSVEIKKTFASGKTVAITKLKEGSFFGEAMVFAKINQYPSTIFAAENTRIILISQDNIIKICTGNEQFLRNFLSLLSDKLFILDNKINYLSLQTIRQKISYYLLEQYRQQKSLTITLPLNRKQLAENLAIPRPSLSRELIILKNKGIIAYNKNIINILQLEKLKEL